MRAVLPGKPRAGLQTVCIGSWDGKRLIAYVTGNAFVILSNPTSILQTIYDDDEHHLEAIAVDEKSGKIAVCARCQVRVYKPYGREEDALRWSLQHSFDTNGDVKTLSWGMDEELLVGGSSLTLFSTLDVPTELWRSRLANEAKFAQFSYDSEYIASTSQHDRFVKVWRRLSDTRFDFSYLSHPAATTNMHWRRPYHIDQSIDNVLYTFCSDNIVRIWATTDPHGLQVLRLCGQLDLKEAILFKGLSPTNASSVRFAFILKERDLVHATEHAVQSGADEGEERSHALSHLIEVANRGPDLCFVFDDQGHLSIWAIEHGTNTPQEKPKIFDVTHRNGVNLDLSSTFQDGSNHVQFYSFCNQDGNGHNLLVHHFDGRIECFQSNIADLFDSSSKSNQFALKSIWTGHSEGIRKIVRNVSGSAVVSRTETDESILWKHVDIDGGTSVIRQSMISDQGHIHRICVLRNGEFVIFLHHEKIALWDTRSVTGQLLATCDYSLSEAEVPLCILLLPETNLNGRSVHIATITTKMNGVVWEVQLPQGKKSDIESSVCHGALIREFCRCDLGQGHDLAYVLPVDPAGSAPVASEFLDTFARDIAISYTRNGLLRSWTAKIDHGGKTVNWLETCSVETGITEPALASGSSIRKAALVSSNRSELTIWDVRAAQLEFSQDYSSLDTIQDLDWTSTPDNQSILAVGFRYQVFLLAQMRYDYLNKGPAWAVIQKFDLRGLTPHPIGDSTWLSGGNLIVGAGNQLFIYNKTVDQTSPFVNGLGLTRRATGYDIFDVVTRLNGPLPVYHPQFLGQYVLAGKNKIVHSVLLALHKTLKYHVEGEPIDKHLLMETEQFYIEGDYQTNISSRGKKSSKSLGNFISADREDDEEAETLTENVASALTEKLTKFALPQLSRQEQINLADIVECVALVEKQRRSLDDNAARFMLFFRQHALHRARSHEVALSWREINWAYHSNSQDILADMVSRQFHGKILWEHARECGLFMWLKDPETLKSQFEIIARNEYTKSDLKNPIDCSLYYLALKKKTVLQGLWRMAGWNKEQGATSRLLSNNFSEKKWQTAAMKNAYALLGKHRYEYAAAFFLLADCLKDAVNVILNQLKDLQLAIAVTRVYEGEGGPVLKELLEEKVLPLAANEGNRWLAAWAFWMLNRRDMAVRALISPVYTLLETPQTPDLQSKFFLTDDPALVVFYSQLRQKTLQTLRGASKVTPKVEWAFVLHNARLYDRMGCDLLALDLVRNWEFLLPAPTESDITGIQSDPRQMLRRRSSLVVADLPVHSLHSKDAQGHKPPPSVFEEPESSSLLDSFGF